MATRLEMTARVKVVTPTVVLGNCQDNKVWPDTRDSSHLVDNVKTKVRYLTLENENEVL